MGPVAKLAANYTENEILKFLLQAYPHIAPKVEKMLSSGHNENEVVGFFKNLSKRDFETKERAFSKGIPQRGETLELLKDNKKYPELAKKGLLLAGTALGGIALARALPRAAQAVAGQVLGGTPLQNPPGTPPVPQNPTNPILPQQPQAQGLPAPQSNNPQPNGPAPNQPIQPQAAQQIPQAPQNAPIEQPENLPLPEEQAQPIEQPPPEQPKEPLPEDVLWQKYQAHDTKGIDRNDRTFMKVMRDLEKKGEAIDEPTFKDLYKDYEIAKKTSKSDKEIVNYLNYVRKQYHKKQEETSPIKQPEIEENIPPKQPIPEHEPVKKLVALANGKIGEILSEKNGIAKILVDGEEKHRKISDLEPEPEEVKNSKFDFDLNEIPEDLRSAPLNEVYVPDNRRDITVKYNAGLKPIQYIYYRKDGQPIPEDFINKIIEGVQLPITSGSNFWGAWNAEVSDSRGAANYKELVSNSQEEGQENDPTKEYWVYKKKAIYEHPYLEKKGKEELRRLEKEFNERKKANKPKKPKK